MIRLQALVLFGLAAGCATASPAMPVPVRSAPPAATAPESDGDLGQLDFVVTGNAACQRQFKVGMLALHSFQYGLAAEKFQAALGVDPGCAMAAWGEAMSYVHPVWREIDRQSARAALARATGRDKLSARERAYLDAAAALLGPDDDQAAYRAWLAATATMERAYPDDDEVILQHVLALLAVYANDPEHVREQMQAGALALGVLERRPSHPGAAHYVIHAFDTSEHAILALPAARIYARIAPASNHALHMPSHTFTHLGMWRDVVQSNIAAYAASVAAAKARGNPATAHDWHSYSWLVAAHVELGQLARARTLIDEARALLVATEGDTAGFRNNYANMIAAYVFQAGAWDQVDTLVAPVFEPVPGEDPAHGEVACAMHAPGARGAARAPYALFARSTAYRLKLEAAIRRGDAGAARESIAGLTTTRDQMARWRANLNPTELALDQASLVALTARAQAGQKPTATALEHELTALDALDRIERGDTSGPAFVAPAGELAGERLLAAGRAKEALARYEAILVSRPNRAASLLGAARAAVAARLPDRARSYYATLAELWSDADSSLPALAEVRAGAK